MNKDETKTSLKKYTSPFIWKIACERELETEQNCNILTLTLMTILWLSAGCWLSQPHLVINSSELQLTDVLSYPNYIIVQSPTQYLPITGHRDVSLPLSLEWHVWLSSSENNCHAVHRSFSSGALVCECTVGFYLVPFCQPSSPTPMEYALPLSLEWHVWPGRRSIYNT